MSHINEFSESDGLDVARRFEDIKLSEEILRGIFAYGWERPSPIQQKAIPPLISRRDTIAQAQSGTGKTGSFSISALSLVDESINSPQIIMLSPVHDLAIQTYSIIEKLSVYTNIKTTLLIGKGFLNRSAGGGSVSSSQYQNRKDIPEPDFNAHVVAGTPGRVLDCIKRGYMSTSNLKLLILDEADEMLSKGFKDQIQNIFSFMPNDVQVGLFSATMPSDILELTNQFMRNPIRILVKNEELTLEGISQFYVAINTEQQKYSVLLDIYDNISVTQAIIFVNSKPKAIMLKEMLEKNNHTISVIHGGLNQYERNDVLNNFRNGKNRILISTDILSRGIDIQQISLVLNYDIPYRVEQYIHRIGRSGRFGKKGVAINLVTQNDAHNLKKIERYYHTSIEMLPSDYVNYLNS